MMIVVCPSCQSRYKFDETKLGERARARTRCARCGGAIDIVNPTPGGTTVPPTPRPAIPSAHDFEPPPTPLAATPVPAQVKTAVMRSGVPAAEEPGSQTMAGRDLHSSGALELPKDKRFSLAIIQGAATGQIHQITKSRTTLGRAGNDIDLDDPEASRAHAIVEVLGDQAILRDLGSTNGTWIENDRIEQHVLANQSEFRIGSHALMFIITDLD